MGKRDFTGSRGEAIAYTRLSEVCRENDLPYFFPHYLGEKCPLFDYLVDLVDAGPYQLFCFVQVKATREGYTRATKGEPRRLKVKVTAQDVRRMVSYPAPTYVVGVDEVEERAYLIAIYGTMNSSISSISTTHEVNCDTLRRLWEEVSDYWKDRKMERNISSFVN